jgi:putative hydrolase of the HAD superfamily
MPGAHPVWLFDLDNTLHNASSAAFAPMSKAMGDYIERELGLNTEEANALRGRYFDRYGNTLLGLVRHYGVDAAHFLHETHQLPGLEGRVQSHPHDLAALRRLPGRKLLLTNAPLHYTRRVLGVLGIARYFDAVVSIEDMHMFGSLRPKPDARMLRRLAARLRVLPTRCVLVEDSLENQKAARRVGMRTVWMQRWARAALASGAPLASHGLTRTPPYVDRRVRGLRTLLRAQWMQR